MCLGGFQGTFSAHRSAVSTDAVSKKCVAARKDSSRFATRNRDGERSKPA